MMAPSSPPVTWPPSYAANAAATLPTGHVHTTPMSPGVEPPHPKADQTPRPANLVKAGTGRPGPRPALRSAPTPPCAGPADPRAHRAVRHRRARPRRPPADPLLLKPSGSVQSVGRGEETVGGRPQHVIPVTIASGRAGLRRTGCGLRTAGKEGKHNGRIKSPGLPWDADQPGRTKQRPNPEQPSSDPGGSENPCC